MFPAWGTSGDPQIATPCLRNVPNDSSVRAAFMEALAKASWRALTVASLCEDVPDGEVIRGGAMMKLDTSCRGRDHLLGCIRGPMLSLRVVIGIWLSSGRGSAALRCLSLLAGMHLLHELKGNQPQAVRCLGKWRMAKFEGTAKCLGRPAVATPRGHSAKSCGRAPCEFVGPPMGLGRRRTVCGGSNRSVWRREMRTSPDP
jgi:hypothetical protein